MVTGAARGIGAAIAGQVRRIGATGVLTDPHAYVEATAKNLVAEVVGVPGYPTPLEMIP